MVRTQVAGGEESSSLQRKEGDMQVPITVRALKGDTGVPRGRGSWGQVT